MKEKINKGFRDLTEDQIYILEDFPLFMLWNYGKVRYEKLNKISSKFNRSLTEAILKVAGQKITEEQLVDYATRAVLEASIYSFFSNSMYETGEEDGYSGGNNSLEEQFTVWAISDSFPTYDSYLEKYREREIHLFYPENSLKNDDKLFDLWTENYSPKLIGLIEWVQESGLLRLFREFNDGTHDLFKNTSAIQLDILRILVSVSKDEETVTQITKNVISYFEKYKGVYSKKEVLKVIKKYLNTIIESNEYYCYKTFLIYTKYYDEILENVLGNSKMATDLRERFISEPKENSTLYFINLINDEMEKSGANYLIHLFRDLMGLLLYIVKNKLDVMHLDLLNEEYEEFFLEDELPEDKVELFNQMKEHINSILEKNK